MHIPGVQMVHCSVCMQQLVSVYELYETFSEKIAALATETSFICEYCEKEGVHPICTGIFYVKIPAGRAHAPEILPINCHYPIFYPSLPTKNKKGDLHIQKVPFCPRSNTRPIYNVLHEV